MSETGRDPWQYRCPEKHSSWECRGSAGYYCEVCESHFQKLRDMTADSP